MSESFHNNEIMNESSEAILERKLEIIQSMDCGIGAKIAMLLIVLDLKPATPVDLFVWNEDLASIKKKIEESGLFFDDIDKPPFSNPKRVAHIAVANSQEIATEVARCFRDPIQHHEELGRYMGYPETAIEAFVEKRERYDSDGKDQNKLLEEKGLPWQMIGFALSNDNYEEEIGVMEKWWNAIRDHAPNLYNRINQTKYKDLGPVEE